MSEDLVQQEHFRYFHDSVASSIKRHCGENNPAAEQKEQVENLVGLETDFRQALVRHRNGPKVYQKFVEYIRDEKRNILAARPFFRERQPAFTQYISTALKTRSWRRLLRFNINYQFVLFAMANADWRARSRPVVLAKQVKDARNKLIECNMPLAISRARMFFRSTPKSQLDFMDLVQIATEGLMSAIDKFVLPYDEVFRSVAIGRMVGNFIETYSSTHLHFYPTEKRKIYRANKYMSKFPHGGFDYEEMADFVNQKDTKPSQLTTSTEIASLVAAASVVSANTKIPSDPEGEDNVSRYAAPESCRPDIMVENQEALNAVLGAATELTLFEKKLLRLKGITIEVK